MQFKSQMMADGYFDHYDQAPPDKPLVVGSPAHRAWSIGWILAASESGAIPPLPEDYVALLLSRDREDP